MPLPQDLEAVHESLFAPSRCGCIAEIDEKTDDTVVACRLFGRDQSLDLVPYGRLFLCDLTDVFRTLQRGLALAPRLLDPGSF